MGAGGQCYLVRPSACKERPGTCAVIVKVNIYPSLYRYRSFDWVIGRCAEVVPKHRDCQARHWYIVQKLKLEVHRESSINGAISI